MIARLYSYPTIVALLTLLSAGMLIFVIIKDGGIHVSYDANNYMSIADSLLAGNGFVNYKGESRSFIWPPGYPVILATISALFQISAYHAGIIISLFSHGVIVFISLMWLRAFTSNRIVLMIGILLILLAVPLIITSLRIRSDVLATAAILSVVFWLYHIHRNGSVGWYAILGITAAVTAITMVRWMGISVGVTVAAIFMLIIWEKTRFTNCMLYLRALPPVLVPLMCMVTWAVMSPDGGATWNEVWSAIINPAPVWFKFTEHVGFYVVGWFAPLDIYSDGSGVVKKISHNTLSFYAGVISLEVIIVSCVWALWRGVLMSHYSVPFVFIIIYLSMLLVITSTVWSGQTHHFVPRHTRVDPLYIPIILMLLMPTLNRIKFRPKCAYMAVLGGLVIILIQMSFITSSIHLRDIVVEGRSIAWTQYVDTDFTRTLQAIPHGDGSIYSNHAALAYYLRGQPTQLAHWMSPSHREQLTHDDLVVWFKVQKPKEGAEQRRQRMLGDLDLNMIYESKIGAIYQVSALK